MKSGIVMEIDGKSATVMLSGGRFTTVRAKSAWKVGDTVWVSEKKYAYMLEMAACLAVFLIAGGMFLHVYNAEKMVISMDVNPSIEIVANRFGRVIDVKAMNEDAEPIVADVSLKNKTYTQAVELLVESEGMQEYLAVNDDVTFSVASGNGDGEEIAKKVTNTAEESLQRHGRNHKVESLVVDEELLDNAHHMGVTAGKYVYLEELEQYLPDMDVEAYSHHSIGELKEEISHCKSGGGNHSEDSGPGHAEEHRLENEQEPADEHDEDSGQGHGEEHY